MHYWDCAFAKSKTLVKWYFTPESQQWSKSKRYKLWLHFFFWEYRSLKGERCRFPGRSVFEIPGSTSCLKDTAWRYSVVYNCQWMYDQTNHGNG